jgi:hypothetical protein
LPSFSSSFWALYNNNGVLRLDGLTVYDGAELVTVNNFSRSAENERGIGEEGKPGRGHNSQCVHASNHRRFHRTQFGVGCSWRWIGIVSSLVLIPLIYLFVVGLKTNRRAIYFVWLALMFLFALFELIVDDILRVDFRNIQWAVIPYVMFFFAATGGMIGVASQAGKRWTRLTCAVFLMLPALAFVQRGITGM